MKNKWIIAILFGIIFGSFWSFVLINKFHSIVGIVVGISIGIVMACCGYKLAGKKDKKNKVNSYF